MHFPSFKEFLGFFGATNYDNVRDFNYNDKANNEKVYIVINNFKFTIINLLKSFSEESYAHLRYGRIYQLICNLGVSFYTNENNRLQFFRKPEDGQTENEKKPTILSLDRFQFTMVYLEILGCFNSCVKYSNFI